MNMFTNDISNIVTPAGFVQLLELLLKVLMFLYAFFAFLVTRQVSIMNRSFKTNFGRLFTTIAVIHVFTALLLFLAALFLI